MQKYASKSSRTLSAFVTPPNPSPRPRQEMQPFPPPDRISFKPKFFPLPSCPGPLGCRPSNVGPTDQQASALDSGSSAPGEGPGWPPEVIGQGHYVPDTVLPLRTSKGTPGLHWGLGKRRGLLLFSPSGPYTD